MTTVGDFNPGPAVTSTANLVAGLSATSVPVPIPLDVSAATYAAARLLSGINTGDRLQVLGRTSQSDGGQGLFTWVAGGTTSINDGIELSATGGIWRRAGIFLLDPAMLGLLSFTFATLPTPTQMTNMPAGIRAYTTDAGVVSWTGLMWLYLATGTPTVVNLRQLGVTASTSAAYNTNQLITAVNEVGAQGTVVVPNWGLNPQGNAPLPTNHLGFTIPGSIKNGNPDVNAGLTLTGENSQWFNPGSGAWLQCVDNTALGIGLANGAVGFSVSNLKIGGGFFGIRTGPAGSPQVSNFAFENLHFIGPFGRTALAFAGHNEHGSVKNCYFEYGGSNPNYAIEWLNEPQGNSAMADILFDFVWCYGAWKVPIYLVNENSQESLQGIEFRNLRMTQQQYCAIAIRAGCNGILFSRATGSESGNQAVSSGSRVDLFVDCNQYGGPVSILSPQIGVAGTGSTLSAPDFPILCRNATLNLDLTNCSDLQRLNINNSVGIGRVLNDTNTSGGGVNAIVNGTDPSSGIDSHLTTYLGNLGSNQPIFDNWPRFPMFDDTHLYQDLEPDEDDTVYLNAA